MNPYRVPCPPPARRRVRCVPVVDVLLSATPVAYAVAMTLVTALAAGIWLMPAAPGVPVPWQLRAFLSFYPVALAVLPNVWIWQWWRDDARELLAWREE